MRPALTGLCLMLAACASQPQGTRLTAEEYAALEGAEETALAVNGVADDEDDEERALRRERWDLDKRVIELQRRRGDHARDLQELALKRQRTSLDNMASDAEQDLAVESAQREHRLAVEAVEHFEGVELPYRMAQDELSLARGYDGLLETREELAQLEMMYGEENLGDATAEIVLNRTRRRLQRAEESHRLREANVEDQHAFDLARDLDKLHHAVRGASVALANAERKRDAGALGRTLAEDALEAEALKLQRALEDIERDAERLDDDLADWARRAADAGGAEASP